MGSYIQNIKGTADILPDDIYKWHFLEKTIHDTMRLFNYNEMRTPLFEKTDLFARGIGELTDIVSNEMYTFLDRGKKSLTLKPEMTAPIMRAYLQHSMQSKTLVTKVFYISPMFRQENPQAGRQRQFHQFGAESIGSEHPETDAEIIVLASEVFKKVGLADTKLTINTLGDAEARNKHRDALKSFLKPHYNELCKTCQDRFETNPLRILDCKNPGCREITADAPVIIEFIDAESKTHYERVKEILKSNSIDYFENPKMVRGLDYYTHTVFEISSTQLGAQDAICGGGRYNLLARELGSKDVPAVGFAAGMERTLLVLEKSDTSIPEPLPLDIFFIALGDSAVSWAQSQIYALRTSAISCDMDYMKRSMKAQMREANRQGARFTVIVGDNELQSGNVILKDMEGSNQISVKLADFVSSLEQKFHG